MSPGAHAKHPSLVCPTHAFISLLVLSFHCRLCSSAASQICVVATTRTLSLPPRRKERSQSSRLSTAVCAPQCRTRPVRGCHPCSHDGWCASWIPLLCAPCVRRARVVLFSFVILPPRPSQCWYLSRKRGLCTDGIFARGVKFGVVSCLPTSAIPLLLSSGQTIAGSWWAHIGVSCAYGTRASRSWSNATSIPVLVPYGHCGFAPRGRGGCKWAASHGRYPQCMWRLVTTR